MENLNIQEIWKQNETLLMNTRKLNETLLREVKLDKAKSSLRSMLFLPVSTLILYIIMASYGLNFAFVNREVWYFAFSGVIISVFSVMLVVASVRQIKQILSLDYNAPILQLQKDISRIKVSIVYNFKIVAWLLPFGSFVGLFFFKVLFDVDLVALGGYNIILSFCITTLVLEVLSLLMLRALQPKNINKKWLNWLLKGNGSQVDEALGFFNEIKAFEQEFEDSNL